MSSLREVKDRIASVRSTLKITSAMKLVASSKLRKAQRTIESLRPYASTLQEIYAAVAGEAAVMSAGDCPPGPFPHVLWALEDTPQRPEPTVVLAFSSNSSMCGAFNVNVIKQTLELIKQKRTQGTPVEVWAFGRKMAEALRKNGTPAARDYTSIVAHPDYAALSEVAAELRNLHAGGRIAGVELVYTHFVSTGRQQVVTEDWLKQETLSAAVEDGTPQKGLYIMEPSARELLETLRPQVLDLLLYAALLDSAAAEHAARMVAMQAATDNGEQLLSELTLEYNKGRQQKITSEILDLVSGAESS